MKKVEETFNFLYVGHWLQGKLGEDRKDTGMLIKVFLETFKDKKKRPGLILKTSGAGFSVLDREATLEKIRQIRLKPGQEVKISEGFISGYVLKVIDKKISIRVRRIK